MIVAKMKVYGIFLRLKNTEFPGKPAEATTGGVL